MMRDFHENTQAACGDPGLAQKLKKATERQGTAREAICTELEDVERFRSLAADLRDDVLMNLDLNLALFMERAEAAGIKVHWAEDAEAACDLVRGVAKDHGVERIVKSKSMITEEIGLTPVLEKAGMEVVETDLGEFIIQLAGQKPSHIVIPAVHLSAGEVNAIFEQKIGYRGVPEPEALTRAARIYLREKFKTAQMGISGVNFGMAEQGLWTICTNEGNGRYVAGLPDVYLAVMGIERLVRDAHGVALMMKLLARFATGQRITQYVNLVHAPETENGPRHVHLVILDNGRSRILGTEYWRMLRCIRCGACLNVCPVFKRIGGQSFQGCYSGPMGSVLLPLQMGMEASGAPQKACSLCGLCDAVCPVKIPLSEMLLDLRNDWAAEGRGSPMERLSMAVGSWILQHPVAYRLARKMLRLGLLPRSQSGWIKSLPSLAGQWTREKDLPLPAKKGILPGKDLNDEQEYGGLPHEK